MLTKVEKENLILIIEDLQIEEAFEADEAKYLVDFIEKDLLDNNG